MKRLDAILKSKWTKACLFVLCLVPLGELIWMIFTDGLGPNPINSAEHFTGDWTIRFVCITLAVTPLREILRQPQLIRFRRMLGLYAFFYGSLHFTTWFAIDNFFNVHDISKDIVKRPFVTVGFTAFVLMIPLAITSTKGMVRRLGYKRWLFIHRAIYVTAILAVIHYLWLVKSDKTRPLRYGAVVAVLLLWRVGTWLRDRKKRQAQHARLAREAPSRIETAS
ncbi:MAG TPA: protein-methionine-sulfoxide reductase heme-binding subunit MsrQ [Candidatus Acidoferrales bacterium]|nr:protein-methionine-sulfoxide reductase heme-binding subunit MsrQ [Candidatus Acidoferrales bacterium]